MAFATLDTLIARGLEEDLNRRGDVTTAAVVPPRLTGEAHIIAKERGVMAGLPVAEQVFKTVDASLEIHPYLSDGAEVLSGSKVMTVRGAVASILTAERTALNFLGRLSGIATLTLKFVAAVAATKARIVDTRKTTPGWRELEKYAVRVGGGTNHRFGLFDMVLIKENHIVAAGSITEAVTRCREYLRKKNLDLKIEVETRTLREVEEALSLGVDRILLDNMRIDLIREAVRLVNGRAQLEASGGITLENVRDIALAGVDYISVGALTHSAKALDLTLLL